LSCISEETEKPGTYCAVYPDEETIVHIKELCAKLGIKDPTLPNKLHATVLYSRKHVDHDVCRNLVELPVHGVADELALFSQQDGKKCLVLKFSSIYLQRLHDRLIKTGGTHDFPSYETHVTLARDLDDSFVVPDDEITVPLVFNKFEVKNLDEDWK
jgi:2'-5' RNA ligase